MITSFRFLHYWRSEQSLWWKFRAENSSTWHNCFLEAITSFLYRVLTVEDITQRRELIKQKQLDKATTNDESTNQTVENEQITTENDVVNGTKTESVDENVFLAFARVFSGRLKRGQKIFVLGPRHDPALFVGKVRVIDF